MRVGAPHGRQDTRHARGIAIQERGRGPASRDSAAAGTTDCSMPGTCSQLAMGLGSFAHLANRSSEPAAISRIVMLAPRRAATACASPGRDEATSGTLGVSRDPPRATASRRRWHQPRRARRYRQRRAGDERVELQWRFDGGRGDKGNNARTVERGTLAGRRRSTLPLIRHTRRWRTSGDRSWHSEDKDYGMTGAHFATIFPDR